MGTHKVLVLDRSEALAEDVRAALAGATPPIEIVSCTRIGSIDHVQEHEGPFSALIAGSSLVTKSGLKRLAALHRGDPALSIVIAMSERPDASLREIVQVGADDLLQLPADVSSIRGAVRRALEIAERRGNVTPVRAQDASIAPVPASRRLGRVITVGSPTGGCGKTFYATNMAMFLARHSEARVVLVDLDLQFGEVTTALRLKPVSTIVDALAVDESEDLADRIEDFLCEREPRISVLAAPREPAEADRITPVEVTRVIEALRQRFDYVVVDTPAALAETVLAALDVSEHLFVMATLDLPSVRNLSVFLSTLQKLQISSENISLVMNKIERNVGLDVEQLSKLFPQGFRSTIPYAREVSRSINLGEPVVTSAPASDIARRISAGLREFLPDPARYVPPARQRSGFIAIRKLFGGRKPDEAAPAVLEGVTQ